MSLVISASDLVYWKGQVQYWSGQVAYWKHQLDFLIQFGIVELIAEAEAQLAQARAMLAQAEAQVALGERLAEGNRVNRVQEHRNEILAQLAAEEARKKSKAGAHLNPVAAKKGAGATLPGSEAPAQHNQKNEELAHIRRLRQDPATVGSSKNRVASTVSLPKDGGRNSRNGLVVPSE